MNEQFEFVCSVKIINGENSINKIAYELRELNSKKPLILSDNGIKASGLLDKVLKVMKKSNVDISSLYTDIPKDSSTKVINAIISYYKLQGCDGVVALGGGSVIDTAKGVRLSISSNSSNIKLLMGNEVAKKGKSVPFIVIPTTCGTGSECTSVAVIKDDETNIKMELITTELLPNTAILDANMILSLPNKFVSTTAIDALCHAIEAYSGRQKNVICDSFATTSIKLIFSNLIDALRFPDVIEYKQNLILASSLAGICFSNSMVSLVHAIGHSLGSVMNIPHGTSMAMLLPECMRANLSKNAAYYQELDGLISSKSQSAENFINHVEEFIEEACRISSVSLKVSDYGEFTEEKIIEICKLSLTDGAILVNNKLMKLDDIKTILYKIK